MGPSLQRPDTTLGTDDGVRPEAPSTTMSPKTDGANPGRDRQSLPCAETKVIARRRGLERLSEARR